MSEERDSRTFDIQRGPILELLWLDSAGGHGWHSLDDELANDGRWRAMHCRAVGYLIFEDDQVLELVSGLSGEGFVQCTNIIPKFAIVDRRVLADGSPSAIPTLEKGS